MLLYSFAISFSFIFLNLYPGYFVKYFEVVAYIYIYKSYLKKLPKEERYSVITFIIDVNFIQD